MGLPLPRALLFLLGSGALVAFAFWIYLRVELSVPAARRLAVVRSLILILVLYLLFDPKLPAVGAGGVPARWALIDASGSMAAATPAGEAPWAMAQRRAEELRTEGWNVVWFGGGALESDSPEGPGGATSELAPALRAAAEGGAREVHVVSDLRFDDAVAARSALETLPVTVTLEGLETPDGNTGIARLEVSDVLRPDEAPTAEVEVFGGAGADSLVVEIFEEGAPVARLATAPPSPGLRSTRTVELPPAAESGRRRYTARVVPAGAGDVFPDDDEAVAYANIGYEAGALVLLSTRPDWEPRFLLPVLEDVTGLPVVGYLRAGDDRWVRLGVAADRGQPVDSTIVRRAASDAALLVVHGIGEDADPWVVDMAGRPGRRLLLPGDEVGAAIAGVTVEAPRAGEWYASPDVPTSPIAGALAGVALQGLPPLTEVMVPENRPPLPPLQLQLRGAGAPESALLLVERASGRTAVALASGFWRWAMRPDGREPYRRFWSGVAGWLLADERVAAAEPRPLRWVNERGAPIRWVLPQDSMELRLVVENDEGVVTDTVVASGNEVETPVLAPGDYRWTVLGAEGDTASAGRMDVAAGSAEMLPAPMAAEVPPRVAGLAAGRDADGRPLRTSPWPYLLLIALLCGEWVVRRRSGLR